MFFSMVRLVLLLRIRIGSMIRLCFGGGASCRLLRIWTLGLLLWLLPLLAPVTGVRTPNAKKMCCCYIFAPLEGITVMTLIHLQFAVRIAELL